MNHSGTDVEEAIANNDLLSDSQMSYMSLCDLYVIIGVIRCIGDAKDKK